MLSNYQAALTLARNISDIDLATVSSNENGPEATKLNQMVFDLLETFINDFTCDDSDPEVVKTISLVLNNKTSSLFEGKIYDLGNESVAETLPETVLVIAILKGLMFGNYAISGSFVKNKDKFSEFHQKYKTAFSHS